MHFALNTRISIVFLMQLPKCAQIPTSIIRELMNGRGWHQNNKFDLNDLDEYTTEPLRTTSQHLEKQCVNSKQLSY